jgi:hypothetical protein
MLQLSVNTTIELDTTQFKQLIEDAWDWKEDWQNSNSLYLSHSR